MDFIKGGYSMDSAKNDEDEGSEIFGLQFSSQTWNFGTSSSSHTPTVASISASYPDTRLSRLSSSDFQDTAFGDLNTSEDVVSSQYCFTRPPDRMPTRLEDFEEENGFDSGFGSLELTPSEVHSEGMCESISPQSTPFWRHSAMEENPQLTNDILAAKAQEEQEPNLAKRKTVEFKQSRTRFEHSNKVVQRCQDNFESPMDTSTISNNLQGLF